MTPLDPPPRASHPAQLPSEWVVKAYTAKTGAKVEFRVGLGGVPGAPGPLEAMHELVKDGPLKDGDDLALLNAVRGCGGSAPRGGLHLVAHGGRCFLRSVQWAASGGPLRPSPAEPRGPPRLYRAPSA